MKDSQKLSGAMSDPRTAPYGSVRFADVDTLAEVDPGNPDINDGPMHLVRRHFDVRAFGVNVAAGNAGDLVSEPHHEADDEQNETNGHEELFAVMTGHAIVTVDGEEIDAPAGTLVFVRDPALIRSARATADGTAILAVGGPVGVPYAVARWEASFAIDVGSRGVGRLAPSAPDRPEIRIISIPRSGTRS